MQLKCFTKNEQGYNSYFKQNDFNFKKENEWRFVPEKKDIGNGLISQNKSTYLKRQEFYNDKLLPYPFRFKESNIEVIFVSNKKEIETLVDKCRIDKQKIKVYNWEV